MEHIAGPVHGHYLAIYTVSSREGYFGYAKVCSRRPDSVWDGSPALRKVAAGPFPTEVSAVQGVLKKAERELLEASEFELLWEASIAITPPACRPGPRRGGPKARSLLRPRQ